MAHDVFISYSTKDKTIADAVCAKLEEHKIRAWIAPRDVPPGSNFAESIIRAINNCKVFVLIWSANSNTSNHILNEINQAFDQGITIIPFRIQDIQPTDEMRYYFGRTHWLDAITPPLENHIAVLRDTILVNLGRELQPSAPPPGLEESPRETGKPTDEPRPVREPVIEKAEGAEPPVASPRPKKSPKIVREIHRPVALPANFTKYIPFAVGGLVVLTLVVLVLSGVFKGSPPEEIAQASPSPTSPITLASTIMATETATPVPDWGEEANAVGEPILAAIKQFQPDFEDDFTQVDPNWFSGPDDPGQCPNASDAELSITDGSMKYSIINCQVGNLHYPDMQYANYVLQLDINFQGSPLGLEFRNWGQSSLGEDVNLDYHIHHDASWGFSVWKNVLFIEGIDGNYGLDFSKPITITIINQSPIFIVYVDSSLLTFYKTQEEYDGFGLDFTINSWGDTPRETLTLELDNFKIWDLDRIDEVNAMAESALAMIDKFPPDFEDDFSQVDPNWISSPNDPEECPNASDVKMSITDGSMKYSVINCQAGHLAYEGMQYGNYVLQMDVNFEQTFGDLLFRTWYPSERYDELNFYLNPDGWKFALVEKGRDVESIDGEIYFDSSLVTITIINKSPTFLVYLNSSLLMSYNDLEMHFEPIGIDFILNKSATETETFELDNVKIWDLDRIEEVNAMAESALAMIDKFPPDFADDFSQIDPDWSYNLHHCPDIDSTPMSVADDSVHFTISPDCPLIGFTHPDFQFQSGDYVIQMDINFQQSQIVFELGGGSPNGFVVDFILGDHGWTIFEPIPPTTDEMKVVGEGSVQSEASVPVTLTIIKKGTAFLFYLNSELLTVYDIQEEVAYEHEVGFSVNNWNCRDACNPETLLLEDFKVWDLDRIEGAIAASESILAAVQERPPDFEDDFSQVDPNWFSYPGNVPPECINPGDGVMSISDGSMKYSITNCQVGNLQYTNMAYSNYVLRLDVNFQEAPLGLEFRHYGQSVMLDYFLQGPDGNWAFQVVEGEDFIEQIFGHTSLDFSRPITITIINQSPTFTVYLDSYLLTLYHTKESYAGPFLMDFTINSWGVTPTEPLTLELDNVKIWDLDKIEN